MRLKYTDYIGKTFGKLTIINIVGKDKRHHANFLCSCACGVSTIVNIRNLESGNTSSCGHCIERELIGGVFGKLTVLEFAGREKHGQIKFKCSCNCGNSCVVLGYRLTSGRTTSCGHCIEQEMLNKTFGELTVMEFAGRNKYHQVLFKCQCSCGRTTTIRGNHLKTGNTKQCLACANERTISRSATLTLDLLEKQLKVTTKREEQLADTKFLVDAVLEYQGNKFAIEIDGTYWHKFTAKRDARKEKLAMSLGHIPIRIDCDSEKEAPQVAENLYHQIMRY